MKNFFAEITSDLSVGVFGYCTAVIFNLVDDAHHILIVALSSIAGGIAWHYCKKLVLWFDKNVLKLKGKDETKS